MANQVDVQAILAALAAQQRPGGTPSQSSAPPPMMPQGYPGSIPQSTGTPSLGGYPLPQPTSSGSVDLSSIRPVSTGQVSIADAIAKAKSIAADRGVPSGGPRDDPRLGGRGYQQRSRSRSPQRRDNFRDNHNPYRDERREREDRRGYGRERSPSPRRASGAFSPRGGGGSGAVGGGRGGDGDSETITVKSALVGLIIGRAGENLRRVESESGARVQFIPAQPGASQRQCTLSGPVRAREAAKRDIYNTIEENGGGSMAPPDVRSFQKQDSQPALREGENSRQILVPDKTVGLIIGRGGETIRDLQDRSGCHVNIVGENKSVNGKRPVNLIGTKEASDKAEAIIWEIVDSDTRIQQEQNRQRGLDPYAGAGGGGGGGGGAYGGAGGAGRGDDGKVEESIQVPSEAVGMIIGKGGETIKQMQNQTSCKINVNQPQGADLERQIDLVGPRSAIEAAKRAIWEKVDTVQQRDRAKGSGGRDDYGDSYSRPQQSSYGQQPPAAQSMPSMPGMPQPGPAGGDPNAPDPYAQYGGYNNYVALWYASMMAQQGGQGANPPGQ